MIKSLCMKMIYIYNLNNNMLSVFDNNTNTLTLMEVNVLYSTTQEHTHETPQLKWQGLISYL